MPIKFVPFIPEPAEGQAVLQNFNRILKYKGSDTVQGVLQRGMPLYEMETLETVGDNKDGNMIIRGECVSACAYLKEKGIRVDLVYIVIWSSDQSIQDVHDEAHNLLAA